MTVAASSYRPVAQNTAGMGAFNEADQNLIQYLGLNPRSPADRAVVAVCRHYGFDPLLKHVVVIPKSGVYITRDGLLHVAHRSGQLDGIVVDKDPTFQDEEWVAKVSVYRKDMSHPFTFPGRYPANGTNKQYAPEMALKAAEAHALRRAFDITGLPTLDEQQPASEPAAWTVEEQPAPATMADDADPDTEKRTKQIFALLKKADIHPDNREDRLNIYRWITGSADIASTKDLTPTDITAIAQQLATWDRKNELGKQITDILNTAAIREAEQETS